MQRFIILAAALAAIIVSHPAAAAADTTMPCWLRTPPILPDPQPIQVPQATADRAASILNAIAKGTFDSKQLVPELQASNTEAFFTRAATIVSALGPVQSMVPFQQRITADATSSYFRVKFAAETLTWVISVDQQNQIEGLSLRRTATCLIVNIVDHGEVPY